MASTPQDDATRADAAQNEAHDAPQADAPQAGAPQADAPQADAPRVATSDERRELVRLWAVTGALLVALGAVAVMLGGAPLEHARVEVELGSAGALDDEALATTVAFSEPFELDATRTIAIVTRGSADRDAAPDAADERPTREGPPVPLEAHGTLLVSLVDLETDQVREIEIDLGDTGRFAGVRAGRYVVRLTGGGAGRALGVVRSGGIPWPLTALAALLLLAPAIWRSLRTLRSHRS